MPILMLNDEKPEDKVRSSVNRIIADTEEQSLRLFDLIEEAPQILIGYSTFREILRSVKRGNTLEASAKLYAHHSCPPGIISDEDCDNIPCHSCWIEFCETYLENLNKTKKGAGK